MQRWASDRIN